MFTTTINRQKVFLLCASIVLLTGCGYKDDLYLPKNNTNNSVSEASLENKSK